MPDALDIKMHFTKTATVDVRRSLAVSMAVARATAHHIRRRVLGGKTATRARAYHGPFPPIISKRSGKPRRHFYNISPAYAEELGIKGHTRWASSAAFHRHVGVRPGTGYVTGGMWSGLQVRNYGSEGALIEFARSSLGAESVRSVIRKHVKGQYQLTRSKRGKLQAKRVLEVSKDKEGQAKFKEKPKLVKNSAKAGRVFKSTKIGLLQPTPAETSAQLAAVAAVSGAVVAVTFGSDREEPGPGLQGDRRLFAVIQREIKRR
jgi:hypothetical protein